MTILISILNDNLHFGIGREQPAAPGWRRVVALANPRTAIVQSDSTSTVLYAFELLIGPSTRPEWVKYRTPLFTVDGGIGTWSWPEKVARRRHPGEGMS